jgi:hypothetical protein
MHVALEHDEHLDGRIMERVEDEVAVGEPVHPRALRDGLQSGRADRVEGRVSRQESREIGRVHPVMLPRTSSACVRSPSRCLPAHVSRSELGQVATVVLMIDEPGT